MSTTHLILWNIRSAHNVGSIFRTADAAGVTHIYLVGYTPAPIDQFKRPRKDIAKVALGAEKTIPWTSHETIGPVIYELKRTGARIIALEQSDASIDYRYFNADEYESVPKALILGEEVKGLPEDVLKHADVCLELPMAGKKESLNVSVAAGIALYKIQFGA